jgi:hypothetical protein
VKKYFLITPLKMQKELVDSILGHWEQDDANAYNPDRQDALSIASAIDSFESAVEQITKAEGQRPFVIATGANFESADGDVSQLTKNIELGNMPCFLLFGTGWGLHPSLVDKVDYKLSPINSKNADGYNHLSVRSAVAIYLDRIFGNR